MNVQCVVATTGRFKVTERPEIWVEFNAMVLSKFAAHAAGAPLWMEFDYSSAVVGKITAAWVTNGLMLVRASIDRDLPAGDMYIVPSFSLEADEIKPMEFSLTRTPSDPRVTPIRVLKAGE